MVFSISAAICIILGSEIFNSLETLMLPLLMVDSTLVNTIAPSMCSWVYKMSSEIKDTNMANLAVFMKSIWMRKKLRALRVNKIYSSGSFFDKETPVTNVETSVDNGVAILLGLKS